MIYFTYSACCKMMFRDFWIWRQLFTVNLFALSITDSTAYDILQCRDSSAVTQTSCSHMWGLWLVCTCSGLRHVQCQGLYMFPVRDLNRYLNIVWYFPFKVLQTYGVLSEWPCSSVKNSYNKCSSSSLLSWAVSNLRPWPSKLFTDQGNMENWKTNLSIGLRTTWGFFFYSNTNYKQSNVEHKYVIWDTLLRSLFNRGR